MSGSGCIDFNLHPVELITYRGANGPVRMQLSRAFVFEATPFDQVRQKNLELFKVDDSRSLLMKRRPNALEHCCRLLLNGAAQHLALRVPGYVQRAKYLCVS